MSQKGSVAFISQSGNLGQAFEIGFIERFMEIYRKPVIGVSMADGGTGTVRPVPGCRYSAVIYQTPETAVNVLAGMVSYSRFLAKTGEY